MLRIPRAKKSGIVKVFWSMILNGYYFPFCLITNEFIKIFVAVNRLATNEDELEKNLKGLEELQSNSLKEKEDYFNNITKEIENLQNEIEMIEKLQTQIEDLKSSQEFMTENAIEVAKRKILKAERINEKISSLQKTTSLRNEKQSRIEKAKEVLRKLDSATQESSNEALNAVLQAQQDARRELECVICLEVPPVDTPVFSCLEQHLMCASCCPRILRSCPVCRQSFAQTPLARNRLAEKMISRLQ